MYILIAFFISANPTPGTAPTPETGVAFQEFSSQASCEAARAIVLAELRPGRTHTKPPVCAKK
ncbi:hypothetical protein [Methyloglobulus sp.]|uniref:hypothetical protein n=1 Tax=Methyloglobulus sp. TaxID=2518622 RepID=UPI0032B7679C